MAQTLYEDEVLEVLEDLFSSMFSLEISPAPNGARPYRPGERRLIAGVGITGDWQGTLVVECRQETACRLAGAMLASRPYPRLCEDVRDALGEIANIVAGNLKWMLPGSSTLSLPCVMEGTDLSLEIPGASPIVSLHLQCAGCDLHLTIFQAPKGAD